MESPSDNEQENFVDSADEVQIEDELCIINRVMQQNKILFREQTSYLKNDKGKPVFNQLPPFEQIDDKLEWILPSINSDTVIQEKKRLIEDMRVAKVSMQQQIIMKIQAIDTQNDLMVIKKQTHNNDLKCYEIKVREEAMIREQQLLKQQQEASEHQVQQSLQQQQEEEQKRSQPDVEVSCVSYDDNHEEPSKNSDEQIIQQSPSKFIEISHDQNSVQFNSVESQRVVNNNAYNVVVSSSINSNVMSNSIGLNIGQASGQTNPSLQFGESISQPNSSSYNNSSSAGLNQLSSSDSSGNIGGMLRHNRLFLPQQSIIEEESKLEIDLSQSRSIKHQNSLNKNIQTSQKLKILQEGLEHLENSFSNVIKMNSNQDPSNKKLENKLQKYKSNANVYSKMFKANLFKNIDRKQMKKIYNSQEYNLDQSEKVISDAEEQNENPHEKQMLLIGHIKKIVQHGGNNVLQKFNSFGLSQKKSEQVDDKSGSSVQGKSSHCSDFNQSDQNFNNKGQHQSKFFQNMMDRDSEVLSYQYIQGSLINSSSSMNQKSSDSNTNQTSFKSFNSVSHDQEFQSEEIKNENSQKTLKDNQFNHSKIMRQIEKMLKDLMIDFNEGLIIQMNLNQKLELKLKLQAALQNRQILQEQSQKPMISVKQSKSHLSENDLSPVMSQGISLDSNLIQQMRQNYYLKKSALKQQQKFVKRMSSGLKISKLMAFESDYDFYFQNNQGMFVVQSQLKYVDLIKIKKKRNLQLMMTNVPQYEEMRSELFQEDVNFGQKTLCIDVENILVRKVNILDAEELNMLKEIQNYEDYIIIRKQEPSGDVSDGNKSKDANYHLNKANVILEKNKLQIKQLVQNYSLNSNSISVESSFFSEKEKGYRQCCSLSQQGKTCICIMEIYQIRPYTYEILRATQPFFEIVAMSNMVYGHLEQIIDFIELMLNKPITEMLVKQSEERIDSSNKSKSSRLKKKKKKRRVKKIEPKVFFQFLVCNSNYIYVPEADEFVENLNLLTTNRKANDIFLITSNQFRIVTCIDSGFCAIPVIKFQCFMHNDYQLNLLENYLVKLKYSKDMKSKNQIDFGYLTQSSAISKKTMTLAKNSETEKDFTWERVSNQSFGEGFQQLSLNMDCVIEEEQKESSSHIDNSKSFHSISQGNSFKKGASSGSMIGSIKNSSNNMSSDKLGEGPDKKRILQSLEKAFVESSEIDSDMSSSLLGLSEEQMPIKNYQKQIEQEQSNCSLEFGRIIKNIDAIQEDEFESEQNSSYQ